MLVRGVEWKAPHIKLVPTIKEPMDPNEEHSNIPPKLLLANDI